MPKRRSKPQHAWTPQHIAAAIRKGPAHLRPMRRSKAFMRSASAAVAAAVGIGAWALVAAGSASAQPWTPKPDVAVQWVLSSTLSTSEVAEPVQAFDIDGFDNSAATVAAIHAAGKHAICYIDVGTAENWRPDFAAIPAAAQGADNGWPGEKWLDVNNPAIKPVMLARFALCKAKGFDAVEPDNMDAAENDSGFSVSVPQQNAYDEWVAQSVHALGMSVAQKNYEDQSSTLQPYFDFVIEEQCVQYSSCADLAPYTAAGKAVVDVEYNYGLSDTSWCSKLPAGVQGMAKSLDLTDAVTNCPGVQPFTGAGPVGSPTATATASASATATGPATGTGSTGNGVGAVPPSVTPTVKPSVTPSVTPTVTPTITATASSTATSSGAPKHHKPASSATPTVTATVSPTAPSDSSGSSGSGTGGGSNWHSSDRHQTPGWSHYNHNDSGD